LNHEDGNPCLTEPHKKPRHSAGLFNACRRLANKSFQLFNTCSLAFPTGGLGEGAMSSNRDNVDEHLVMAELLMDFDAYWADRGNPDF
jgi:hypothetical protein